MIKKAIKKILAITLLATMVLASAIGFSKVKADDNILAINGGGLQPYVTYDSKVWAPNFILAYYNAKEMPAYCLNKELDGVDERGSYTLKYEGNIQDPILYSAIVNAYPYKSPEQMGLANKQEAYVATKYIIWSIQNNLDVNKFQPHANDTQAGQRVVNAIINGVNHAKSNPQSYSDGSLSFKEVTPWEYIGNGQVQKVINVTFSTSKVNFQTNIHTSLESAKLLDKDTKQEVKSLETSKDLLLVANLKELVKEGKIDFAINGHFYTNPVIFAKAPSADLQNYALVGWGISKDISSTFSVNHPANKTKISIFKQDQDTKEPLENVEFALIDENKNVVATKTTNKDGQILFDNLLPGKYFLKETKQKDGYLPRLDLIPIDVELNQEFKVTIDNTKEKPETTVEQSHIPDPSSQGEKNVVAPKRILPKTGM